MSGRAFDHATEAFAFIESLEGLRAPEAVVDAMERSFALFGFHTFIVTGLPHPRERFDQVVLLRRWPAGWFELYAGEDYVRVDPVIRMCRNTVQPFEWSEAPYHPQREPRAAEVMNRAHDFGMRRGFCLPIHGLHGYEACLSMSGIDVDLTSRTKPAIHLMAMYAFERARTLAGPQGARPRGILTPREREALSWAAAGKSAADTAEIMGITERTVTAHIGSACQKLDALNKTQAVARAIQHRIIAP